jgi:Ca-activated chloride channel family protein
MTFSVPWALAALLALPLLVIAYRRALGRAARDQEALRRTGLVPVTRSVSRWQHVAPSLLLGALTLLIIGAAGPRATLETPRREGTVILAFDVSNSMQAEDLAPNRLAAAKVAAKAFVAKQPATIKIGVVAFSDTALITQQPTDDPLQVDAAINRLTSHGGTSLGQGIYASLQAISGGKLNVDDKRLKNDPDSIDIGYFGASAIILLSDGQSDAQLDPLAMARLASVAGVRIDSVGLGSPEGASVTVDGVTQQTALDSAALQAIADAANGRYYSAVDSDALSAVYSSIDLKWTSVREVTGLAPYFALLAILAAATAMIVSIVRTGRVIAA